MFVKAVAKASGVDPEKLRKMKKKLEKQKKESAEVSHCFNFVLNSIIKLELKFVRRECGGVIRRWS